MAEAALNGLQQVPDLIVVGGELNADELVVFLGGAVGLAAGRVVDVAGDLLSEAVALVTELLVVAVDFVGVVAVGALAGVHLKVVADPALLSVDWAGEAAHGIMEEADRPLLLGAGNLGRLGVDDGRHCVGTGERRHLGGCGVVLQN